MKKSIYIILSLFLFIPFIVNAETITYDVCGNCNYNLLSVQREISMLNGGEDVVINFLDDASYNIIKRNSNFNNVYEISNNINSLTINGNANGTRIRSIEGVDLVYSNGPFNIWIKNIKKVKISNIIFGISENKFLLQFDNVEEVICDNISSMNVNAINSNLTLLNSNVPVISIENNYITQFGELVNIDEHSFNNINVVSVAGNIEISDQNFSNIVFNAQKGNIKIYNSILNKVLSYSKSSQLDIYNSKFNSLGYINIKNSNDSSLNDISQFENSFNLDLLKYDIYDFNISEYNLKSNTTVYFDKETKLKLGDKLNLAEYLDYYTEDKEMEHTIEDESIAKIENKELTALKEGSTKVTVTTDDGHVIYRINLVVENETLPEKIDKMTIKVPITGNKIKAWVVVVSILLLGIIGISIYLLIKNKKVK